MAGTVVNGPCLEITTVWICQWETLCCFNGNSYRQLPVVFAHGLGFAWSMSMCFCHIPSVDRLKAGRWSQLFAATLQVPASRMCENSGRVLVGFCYV